MPAVQRKQGSWLEVIGLFQPARSGDSLGGWDFWGLRPIRRRAYMVSCECSRCFAVATPDIRNDKLHGCAALTDHGLALLIAAVLIRLEEIYDLKTEMKA